MEQQRKRAQRAALHLLMMARGGRENGAPRLNPPQKNLMPNKKATQESGLTIA